MRSWIFTFSLLFLGMINLACAAPLTPEQQRWDAYFKRKLNDPPTGFVVEALKSIPQQGQGKVAMDMGSGIGHETLLLLKEGYRVLAVDSQAVSFEYMKKLPGITPYQQNITPMTVRFQDLDFSSLPPLDMVVASFSIPFVSEADFNTVWNNVVNKIKPGGYFIVNLFDPEFTYFEQKFRPHMTFHKKSDAMALFKGFKIINFTEVKMPSLKPGTRNYYYAFVAKKLGETESR